MIADLKISSKNLLVWGNMESWSAGTSAAPDGWTLSGLGASVAREATIIKQGTYSAKLTRSGTDCFIYSVIHEEEGIGYWQGRKVTLGVWVYATSANKVRIFISDGVDSTLSSYHTGGSSWEWLTVTKDIAVTATNVWAACYVDSGDTAAYFDGAVFCEGANTFLDLSTNLEEWSLDKKYRSTKYSIARRAGVLIPDVEHNDISLNLKGHVWGTTSDSARTTFDSILQYFNDGEKDIYLYDDRFFRGHLVSESHTYKAALRVIEFTLKLDIPKPYQYYVQQLRTLQTVSSSPSSFTVTVSGNTPTRPKIIFTPSGGTITSCLFENLTTGQKFTFTGTVADGKNLTIDCEEVTVTNDTADAIANFSGDFIKLNPGANSLKFTGDNNAIKVDYQDQWL